MSVSISINQVQKKFGENIIIPNLSTQIKNGEFFTLLGPSGCGKTTLLRMIAGFNSIDSGTIAFDDEVINDIPTYARNIGMVFQSYAIFPHLTVRENVEYGLKVRKTPSKEMQERVDTMLEQVRISEYQDRRPDRLSGGQQQRIALARAIVIHPQVLLMDEPLSNLDAKLRIEMRSVIREIQNEVGITTVYVTHDQEEALAISNRIAVMNHGVIQQIGCPEEIYTRPFNTFVATFIGHSNLFYATIRRQSGKTELEFANGYRLPMETIDARAADGQRVVVGIRPEEFSVAEDKGLPCVIASKTFLGRYSNYFLRFEENLCLPDQPSLEYSQDFGHVEKLYQVGEKLLLKPNPQKINVFTLDGSESLVKDVKRYEDA